MDLCPSGVWLVGCGRRQYAPEGWQAHLGRALCLCREMGNMIPLPPLYFPFPAFPPGWWTLLATLSCLTRTQVFPGPMIKCVHAQGQDKVPHPVIIEPWGSKVNGLVGQLSPSRLSSRDLYGLLLARSALPAALNAASISL